MSEQPREGTRVHDLKTLPGFIDAIEESGKSFEVRNNDRRFKTGDTLRLREYDPDEGYSGREIHRRVGYVLDGFPGIEKGYCVMALEPAQPQPRGERDDLAARLDERAELWERKGGLGANIAAGAYRQAAEMARASTHPEQWVSGDDREWLLWITSYVLNRHEFTDSAATDARAALTRIATAIKQPASPTPTEQGEDRTRVEWHDGIEDGDELALRQLAADLGCGIPYGCQPSIGKWYAAALDRVLDRLLPLDPAPEQGEARFAADPAPPRGEGDDLAARTVQIIRNRAKIAREQGTTEAQIIRARALDEAANEFADILPALRASTHPEQSGRVEAIEKALLWYADPDHWLDGQAGEWIVEEGNHVSGDGFAHNEFEHDNGERARAALEPASPTPTEQEQIADLKGRLERKTTRLRSTLRVIAALEDEHTSADTREDVVRRLAEAILCDPELLHGHPDTEDTTGVAYEAAERIAAELGLGVSEAVVARDDQDWDEPAPEGEGEAS